MSEFPCSTDRWWTIVRGFPVFAPARSKGFSVSNRPNLIRAGIVAPDLGQVSDAPYATLLKAKADAEVIKIEPPDDGLLRRALLGKTSPNCSGSLRRAAAVILTLLATGPAGATTAVAQQAGHSGTGNAGSAATEEETLVFFRHAVRPQTSKLGQQPRQAQDYARPAKFSGKPSV